MGPRAGLDIFAPYRDSNSGRYSALPSYYPGFYENVYIHTSRGTYCDIKAKLFWTGI